MDDGEVNSSVFIRIGLFPAAEKGNKVVLRRMHVILMAAVKDKNNYTIEAVFSSFPEGTRYLQVPLRLTGRKVWLSLSQLADDRLSYHFSQTASHFLFPV